MGGRRLGLLGVPTGAGWGVAGEPPQDCPVVLGAPGPLFPGRFLEVLPTGGPFHQVCFLDSSWQSGPLPQVAALGTRVCWSQEGWASSCVPGLG